MVDVGYDRAGSAQQVIDYAAVSFQLLIQSSYRFDYMGWYVLVEFSDSVVYCGGGSWTESSG